MNSSNKSGQLNGEGAKGFGGKLLRICEIKAVRILCVS